MASLAADSHITVTLHLPDHGAGRFHFSVLRHLAGRTRELGVEAIAPLFPELAPYVALHGADHAGVPHNMEAGAWYHAAGILFPAEDYADKSGEEECLRRLARLLRIPISRALALVRDWQRTGAEFPSPRAVHAVVMESLQELRPHWQRQADEATMNLPMIAAAMDLSLARPAEVIHVPAA